jgi:hypothetical protein
MPIFSAPPPDLLAACKEAREKITGVEDVFDDLAYLLNSAIARAEGTTRTRDRDDEAVDWSERPDCMP